MNIMSDKPETIPGDELKKWEKRRLQTFIVFCLLYAINGMKYGLFIDTCWVFYYYHFTLFNGWVFWFSFNTLA